MRKIVILIVYISSLFLTGLTLAGDSLALNQRIVHFAQSKFGQHFSNGDCWIFPREDLRISGAKFPGYGGQYNVSVFGRPINISQLTPGDIIHFRNAKFASHGYVYAFTGYDHYAIVESHDRFGTTILHQNWNGVRKVTRTKLNLNDLVNGKLNFYRPQTR